MTAQISPEIQGNDTHLFPDLLNRRQDDSQSLEIPPREVASYITEGVCRICYENETQGSALLHPCKCAGSVRYIHEECLKAWLVSRESAVDNGECELCHTKFKMTFTIVSECSLAKSCQQRTTKCVFIPVLFLVIAMLAGIVYVLSTYYLDKAKSSEEQGYAGSLIFICVFAAFVLCALMTYSTKHSCITRSLQDWQILNIEEIDEISRIEQSKDYSAVGSPLMSPTGREGAFMIIPTKMTVRDIEVSTPLLRPNLATLPAEGNMTVFVSPRIAQSLNITPIRSRNPSVAPTLTHYASTPTLSSMKVSPTQAYDASTKRCEEDESANI